MLVTARISGLSPLLWGYPAYGYAYPSYGYAQATAMAVRTTALIGAMVDALLAELIGDGIAGIRTITLSDRAACLERFPIATA